jgi:hypothetical protein
MLKSLSLNKLLVLFVAAGFLFLLVDSILEHLDILSQDLVAYTPIVFSVIGLAVSAIAAVKWSERWIRALHMFLFIAFVVSAAGLYFHLEEEEGEEMTVEKREHEEKEKDKPPLAPLSFAGLAMVGLLATSRKWHAEVVESAPR